MDKYYSWNEINTKLTNANVSPKRLADLMSKLSKIKGKSISKEKIKWSELNQAFIDIGFSPRQIADKLLQLK